MESPLHGGVDRNRRGCARWRMTAVAPSRGRGSKPKCSHEPVLVCRVAPSRGRGSKRYRRSTGHRATPRRPFTGAWIETSKGGATPATSTGRPFTGAWIETARTRSTTSRRWVAPSRGRGSKHHTPAILRDLHKSPLHGGVDRNFEFALVIGSNLPVAPSRGRGSKLPGVLSGIPCQGVAPSRGRGSKQ